MSMRSKLISYVVIVQDNDMPNSSVLGASSFRGVSGDGRSMTRNIQFAHVKLLPRASLS